MMLTYADLFRLIASKRLLFEVWSEREPCESRKLLSDEFSTIIIGVNRLNTAEKERLFRSQLF